MSSPTATTALVCVSHPMSDVPSVSTRREARVSSRSLRTTCRSWVRRAGTGVRRRTPARPMPVHSFESVRSPPRAAVNNVLRSTAAGTISVPCTGWSPGYGGCPCPVGFPTARCRFAPATTVRPPSTVWLAGSCRPRPPGGGVGSRQNRRCFPLCTWQIAGPRSLGATSSTISSPLHHSDAMARATAWLSGWSRRSTGMTACSSIPL